jgi:hypothetical protein
MFNPGLSPSHSKNNSATSRIPMQSNNSLDTKINKASKFGLVIAGYILAFVIASVATAIRIRLTSGPQAQASSGMYAAGDSFLFMGVFGLLAIPPTALMFFFLRPFTTFWNWFAAACLLFAACGPIVAFANTLINSSMTYSPTDLGLILSLVGILHFFGSPILFVGFAVLSVIAPAGRARKFMLISAGLEVLTGGYTLLTILLTQRFF